MTITHVTEREQQLSNMLQMTNAVLELVRTERDALKANAAKYRWLCGHPQWLGWDADFDADDIDAIVTRAIAQDPVVNQLPVLDSQNQSNEPVS